MQKIYCVYSSVAVGSTSVTDIGSFFYRRFTGTCVIQNGNRTCHRTEDRGIGSGCGDPVLV